GLPISVSHPRGELSVGLLALRSEARVGGFSGWSYLRVLHGARSPASIDRRPPEQRARSRQTFRLSCVARVAIPRRQKKQKQGLAARNRDACVPGRGGKVPDRRNGKSSVEGERRRQGRQEPVGDGRDARLDR